MEQTVDLTSDANVRIELVGNPTLLCPMLEHISGQRAGMVANNLPQAVIVDGAETARIQSGYETKYGRYCIDPAHRDHDVQVLQVIPKLTRLSDEKGRIIRSPETTVVYLDTETPEPTVGYFTIPDYVMLHSGFGYYTKKQNMHELVPANVIPKDMTFVSAPNHDGDLYNLGVNANVCFMGLWETTDDAFIISERFRKKLRHTSVDQRVIAIDADHIPLNLYGDHETYKIFPDIGEQVRDDGRLVGLREYTENDLLISDITPEALRTPGLYDDIYVAPAGATVVDVSVFVAKSKYQQLKSFPNYAQIIRYQDSLNAYYSAIIRCYDECVKNRYAISPEFNQLVVQAKSRSLNSEYRDLILCNKKEPIKLIYLIITFASKVDISRGFKLTSREGAKGVVSDIRPTEDMPSYMNGTERVYADICITGQSPFNRLNSSQNYEQFINYASDVIVQRCKDGVIPYDQQYEYVLGFLKTVRPVFSEWIRMKTSATPDLRTRFLESVYQEGIFHIISPYSKSITPNMIMDVCSTYDIHHVPISYFQYDENGNRYQVDTKYGGIIGSKYMYLLGKIPLDGLSAIGFGCVSQFNLPIKTSDNDMKQQFMFAQTPCRYGEDETAVLCMSLGPEMVCRILGLYSNCVPAQELLKMHLLTDPYPTRLGSVEMTTKDIVDQATNNKIFQHMFGACGLQLVQRKEGV